jgi:hypothetical protein
MSRIAALCADRALTAADNGDGYGNYAFAWGCFAKKIRR